MIKASSTQPPTMTAASLDYGPDPSDGATGGHQRIFKKHKVLPHPNRDQGHRRGRGYGSPRGSYDDRPRPKKYDLVVETSPPRTLDLLPSSMPAHTLKHESRRIPSGPDLPPTPPAHSRNSSSSQSILPSSPTYVESPARSEENVTVRPPVTPPNQRSPPTPDVTPPQPASRPRAIRPMLSERAGSKSTSDSRTESFKTAREDPYTSESDTERLAVRPALPSERTSQSTVRQANGDDRTPKLQPVGLGLGPGLESPPADTLTPKSRGEFGIFDGEWRSGARSGEVVQEWDDNLQRNVTVRKRRHGPDPETPRANGRRDRGEVIEDDVVTPTMATEAVRGMGMGMEMGLHDVLTVHASPKPMSDKEMVESPSESSMSTDVRRFSGMSTKSTVSTVVEAILVDGPRPQRQNTLRHVKKYNALRGSSSDVSRISSAPNSSGGLHEPVRRQTQTKRPPDGRHESYASTSTVNSAASGRARREVWKQGGIPVVIVPDRRSSMKSKEPSLRSTSSRRSKRSTSLNSVPLLNGSTSKDLTPYFERPSRRSRTLSESEGSDQRTIDYPPVVPKRTSSLSAPTSRNNSRSNSRSNSRAGSLTKEGLRAHNALQAAQASRESQQETEKAVGKEPEKEKETKEGEVHAPEVTLRRALSFEEGDDRHHHRLSVDHHGDPLFGKRLSSQNTPFSQASMTSTGTAAEVSEAMAVNIYPHQNTSVLMVDHGSSKPSEGSELSQRTSGTVTGTEQQQQPMIRTTAPDSEEPMTPPQPQPQHSVDGLDYSPLRNPRDAPEPPSEPPAIKFIPATPSGMTPWPEKQVYQGNYFEEIEGKPPRRPSLVRRTFSRRRHSEYGPSPDRRPSLLTRTFSLSRSARKAADVAPEEKGKEPAYPTMENPPAEEHKLHPFWRPAYSDYEDDDHECGPSCAHDGEPEETVYRYPPIDNRPHRNFSQRMKKTFAIFPADESEPEFYRADERRTIRRTPSGNLRVMRHRASLDSVGESSSRAALEKGLAERPYTAPERRDKAFWRSHSLRHAQSHGRHRGQQEKPDERKGILPTISNTLGELGNLSRRFSERRREKRSQELRRKISGPREVRDGVGDVIKRTNFKGFHEQQPPHV